MIFKFLTKAKNNNTLVSENLGDEKNLHPAGTKKLKKKIDLSELFK